MSDDDATRRGAGDDAREPAIEAPGGAAEPVGADGAPVLVPASAPGWQAQTPEGVVYNVTLDQLNEAYLAKRVDGSLRVRALGATDWSTLAVVRGGGAAPAAQQPTVSADSEAPAAVAGPPASVPVGLETRRIRPVLGPALMVAGVLLWGFVVLGTFTTSWLAGGGAPIAQGAAVALLGGCTVAAWVVSVRRSLSVSLAGFASPLSRFVVVGVTGSALWFVVVLLATVIGRSSAYNIDVLLAALLLLASAAAVFMGDRMLGRTAMPRDSARRFLALAAWLGVGMVTLGACVELVAER